jgi:hypothetical protein
VVPEEAPSALALSSGASDALLTLPGVEAIQTADETIEGTDDDETPESDGLREMLVDVDLGDE